MSEALVIEQAIFLIIPSVVGERFAVATYCPR